MNKKLLLIFSVFCIQHSAFAQREANIWCFGTGAGMDFNSGAPVFFSGVAMDQLEGCSSIADNNGNLLFYTDGVTVWNKNHVAMPNGTGLFGNYSTTQSALIIKQPGTSNIYYVFTADAGGGFNGFNYSIVDITLQAGMGDVTVKNVNLLATCDERIAAVHHANGTDIWIATTQTNTDIIQAFLLTSSGISTTPVTTTPGITHITGNDFLGYLKFSQQGNHLAVAVHSGSFELHDFDNSTGIASNPVVMASANYSLAYGVEFSPDGTRLYGSEYGSGSNVYQFDLTAGSAAAIIASATLVGPSAGPYAAALQLAPDGKIYLARESGSYLGVINAPNQLGLACNYVDNGFLLPSGTCNGGLPNYLADIFAAVVPPVALFSADDTTICENSCIRYSNFSLNATSYQWLFPGGTPASDTTPDPTVCYTTAGTYNVSLTASNSSGINTAAYSNYITVHPSPVAPTITQSGDTLFATPGFTGYQWFFGSDTISGATGYFYVAAQSGNYNLIVTDENGCSVGVGILNIVAGISEFGTGSSEIEVFPNPIRDKLFVTGSSLRGNEIQLELYNSIGEKIYSSNSMCRDTTCCVPTTKFNTGIYLLKIISEGKIFTKKIIIEK